MRISKYILTFLLLVGSFVFTNATAQTATFLSRSTLGLRVGGSYYIGDLNQFGHFKNTHLSGGIIYRYYVNSRLQLRGSLSYGTVEGYDSDSKDPYKQMRNFSFRSEIYEVSAGIEFNFLHYKLGNKKYFFTPYVFIEAGVFKMDPTTMYNGDRVRLQPIGTEGQGSDLTNKNPYSLIQFVIPFGVGFKVNMGKKMALTIEYGMRKTFTDYLDDVGVGNFIARDELALQNGDIAADLSNQTQGNFQMTGPRGNPSTKDWYAMFSIGISFSLGKENTCFY